MKSKVFGVHLFGLSIEKRATKPNKSHLISLVSHRSLQSMLRAVPPASMRAVARGHNRHFLCFPYAVLPV